MKKKQLVEGVVTKREFPNKGIVENITVEGESVPGVTCVIKNTLPGQRVVGILKRVRKNKAEARLVEVLKEADDAIESPCPHFGICGSCHYLSMTYEKEQELKQNQVKELLMDVLSKQTITAKWDEIKKSPIRFEYRNKMEFSFGDSMKNGPLSLGMHKRGSMHDIVTVDHCQIMDEDYRKILKCVLDYFSKMYVPKDLTIELKDDVKENANEVSSEIVKEVSNATVSFYHTMQRKGYLRHLLVRKAKKTGEILVDLVTTTQEEHDLTTLKEELCSLQLDGHIIGFLHTKNDSLSDAVVDQGTEIIFGQDSFTEELLGLKFLITPFSFFQTNSLSAEVLYNQVREYVKLGMKKSNLEKARVLYDLYCGTGTISQLMSEVADKVIGVEIVEEAVEAAKENAKRNGLNNCEFIAGDVLKVLDDITEKPDYIILDPPRDGIHPKALQKIINYGVEHLVYVSCKPTSLARDLEIFIENGYQAERICAVNQFPNTVHVESVVLMSRAGSRL